MTTPHTLLVHGMGRSALSMVPLAWSLRRAGAHPHLFNYVAAAEPFDHIVDRLVLRLSALSSYRLVVVGHSLGGLMLRSAIERLPPGAARPERLIMLGTPNHSPRLARRLHGKAVFRFLTGDAGALLADEERMETLPPLTIPATVIIGTGGRLGGFGSEPNDGVVAASEAMLAGADIIQVPVWHTFMMNAPAVREVCLACLTVAPNPSAEKPRP